MVTREKLKHKVLHTDMFNMVQVQRNKEKLVHINILWPQTQTNPLTDRKSCLHNSHHNKKNPLFFFVSEDRISIISAIS